MGIKVMVVDDNEDLRYLVTENLKKIDSSYEITNAVDGADCLKKITQNKPDIILMDIMMPGMDGLETTIKIKQNPDFKDIKIIYLTAKQDSLSKGMGAISGEDYIEKPFDPMELDKRIKTIINKNSP